MRAATLLNKIMRDGELHIGVEDHIERGVVMAVLGKAVPKKVISTTQRRLYMCPTCKDDKTLLYADEYCSKCGQALNWEGTK